MSANHHYYDHSSAFKEIGIIDWRDTVKSYEQGDFVYIYSTAPYMTIKYKCVIEKVNIKFEDKIDDRKYWINYEFEKEQNRTFIRLKLIKNFNTKQFDLLELKRHGLKSAPQSPMRLKDDLLDYILKIDENSSDPYIISNPDELNAFYEGTKTKVLVNRYERNKLARDRCLEHHGYDCSVCGMNFFDVYGNIGLNFIHVHHTIPINEIGEKYIVDPINDLIPVCPNCHAMLHLRKDEKTTYSIEELKKKLKSGIL